MSSRILVVTAQGEVRYLASESEAVRVLTIQPTGARGQSGADGGTSDVKSASFTAANDKQYTVVATLTVTDPSPVEGKGFEVFLRNGTATIGGTAYTRSGTTIRRVYHSGAWTNTLYVFPIVSADISDATSAATENTVVRRDASGGAEFGDIFAGSLYTTASDGIIFTAGTSATIYTQGANAHILTLGANATIYTQGANANIEAQNSSASVKAWNFSAYDATAGASLRNSAGTAIMTWGATAGNISITVDTTSTGHFFSNPGSATAGHFVTKNGTTPTLVAGRSAWFSDSSGSPQFKNGTSSAITLIYSGGPLGTPASGTLTFCTGLPISTGVSGLGTGVATLLTGTPSGTGGPVGTTSPTITTPSFTRSGNGTIITASEGTRSITFGAQSYGTEMVLTSSTVGQGAYLTANGMLESWVNVIANTNTTNLRVMRFGNKTNRFEIQRLNDASNSILGTPFSLANNAPDYAFYMLTSGTIGCGTSTPSEKSLLDLTSTTKGFLPPRMTTVQRDAITSVPAGLMIYNTTTNKLNFYNGSAWEAVTSA